VAQLLNVFVEPGSALMFLAFPEFGETAAFVPPDVRLRGPQLEVSGFTEDGLGQSGKLDAAGGIPGDFQNGKRTEIIPRWS
jgi:hypothetical protein